MHANLFVLFTLAWIGKCVKITQATVFLKEVHTKIIIEGNGVFDLQVQVPKGKKLDFC